MGIAEATDCCTLYRGIVLCAIFVFAFYVVYVVVADQLFK